MIAPQAPAFTVHDLAPDRAPPAEGRSPGTTRTPTRRPGPGSRRLRERYGHCRPPLGATPVARRIRDQTSSSVSPEGYEAGLGYVIIRGCRRRNDDCRAASCHERRPALVVPPEHCRARALGIDAANGAVAMVGHPYRAVGAERDPGGPAQADAPTDSVAVSSGRFASNSGDLAIRGNATDCVVPGVGDVAGSVMAHIDRLRTTEASLATKTIAVVVDGARDRPDRSIGGDRPDAMVPGVGDIAGPIVGDRHVAGEAEHRIGNWPVTVPARPAHDEPRNAIRSDRPDSVTRRVRDPQRSIRRDREACGGEWTSGRGFLLPARRGDRQRDRPRADPQSPDGPRSCIRHEDLSLRFRSEPTHSDGEHQWRLCRPTEGGDPDPSHSDLRPQGPCVANRRL